MDFEEFHQGISRNFQGNFTEFRRVFKGKNCFGCFKDRSVQGKFKKFKGNFKEFQGWERESGSLDYGSLDHGSVSPGASIKEFQEISRNFKDGSVSLDYGSLDHGSVSPGASIKEFQEISRNFKDGSVSPGASIMGASTLWGHIMYFLMFDIYSVTAGVCWGPHVAA